MSRYILALDQGTTSSRAILFDEEARPVVSAQEEFRQIYPRPGWVEHDPEDIWNSQLSTARRALSQAGARAADLAAIGITNQRETTLLWDKVTGRPLHNAIVWQDRRTAPICSKLREYGFDSEVREKTGLELDPYFSGTKLAWLLEAVYGARELADMGQLAFGTVDTYLLWRLTEGSVFATDVSNASRTMLFNLETLDWDEELLRLFGIPRDILPEIRPSSYEYGPASIKVLGSECRICALAGDQQAATFGQACFAPGMVKNTYGTGSFLLMNTGRTPRASSHRLLTTVAWDSGSGVEFALEGSVFVTGAAIQWLRDELGVITQARQTEALALSVPDSGGVYFVPAFAGLGAPYWDAEARGALVGLTRGTGRAHIVRAALEAACFQTRDVIEAMQKDCSAPLTDLRVDGGMTENNALLQMQADILGIPVHRPAVTETTALGVAFLAGLQTGIWKSASQLSEKWKVERTFEPSMSADQRESLYAGWKRAVDRTRSSA